MPTLDGLKEKYSSVLQLIAKGGVRLDHLHVQDDKLFMQGAVASDDRNLMAFAPRFAANSR